MGIPFMDTPISQKDQIASREKNPGTLRHTVLPRWDPRNQ